MNTINANIQKPSLKNNNFFTLESLLGAGIIKQCPDRETVEDFMKYLTDPKLYDSYWKTDVITKKLFENKLDFEKRRTEVEVGRRIYKAYNSVLKGGNPILVGGEIYIFATSNIGTRLQKGFLGANYYYLDEQKFEDMLAGMNLAKIRQQLKLEVLIKQTSSGIDNIMSMSNVINIYSLMTLINDSGTSIGGIEQVENGNVISGGGGDFSGGGATGDMGSVSTDTNSSGSEY